MKKWIIKLPQIQTWPLRTWVCCPRTIALRKLRTLLKNTQFARLSLRKRKVSCLILCLSPLRTTFISWNLLLINVLLPLSSRTRSTRSSSGTRSASLSTKYRIWSICTRRSEYQIPRTFTTPWSTPSKQEALPCLKRRIPGIAFGMAILKWRKSGLWISTRR